MVAFSIATKDPVFSYSLRSNEVYKDKPVERIVGWLIYCSVKNAEKQWTNSRTYNNQFQEWPDCIIQ